MILTRRGNYMRAFFGGGNKSNGTGKSVIYRFTVSMIAAEWPLGLTLKGSIPFSSFC